MDEIALMVKQVVAHNSNGFLRLTNVGGVDIRHLYGQLVTVHGRRDLSGIIGSLPAAMLPADKKDKPFGWEDLCVDVGLAAAEVEELVSIGDFISFRQPLRKLQGKRVAGKALDNRASVAAVTVCLDYLNGRSHDWDIIAVATSQEETRLLGAYTSAYSQRPDAAIAIDVTFGKGPGANDAGTFELGGGPTLDLGPNVHPGILAGLQDAAKALELKVSTATHSRYSGTDAFGLQVAREGIPTGLIGIPLRYMHTMVESIDTADVERSGRLMGEFAARLNDKFIDKLAKGMMER
jgi:endoglucanase